MFVALWEYEVKPGSEERFKSIYGPDGDWVLLFRQDPEFIQTRLLREAKRESAYVTLDLWKSRSAYETFMQSHREAYEKLDVVCSEMTVSETKLGLFESTT